MRTISVLTFITAIFMFTATSGATDYLRIQDPQRTWRYGKGTIEKAVLSVRPAGIYMEYGLYLDFSAKGLGFLETDTVEVQFQFELPEEAIVYDSWLWIGDTIIRGTIMDKWTAEAIYEEIVNRRRDPSILYKRSGRQYELRVFPMAGTGTRRVKISYLVPTDWNASIVSSPLPTNLVNTSLYPTPALSILTWPDDEWSNPRIPDHDEIVFTPEYDSTFGDHNLAHLPYGAFGAGAHFSFDAPLKNGLYVNSHTDSNGGFYQLALLPSKALDLNSSRKVAVLFDYDTTGSTLTSTDVISGVKSRLYTTLTAKDSFNLIFSRVNIYRASEEWLCADSSVIDSVFASLGGHPLASYSNLPALMANGIDYIMDQGNDGAILLVSNSDQVGTSVAANQLIQDLLGLMTEVIPIHVVDYQNQNYPYNWIGGRYYYGNEYFYTNITRYTRGNYHSIRNDGDFPSILSAALQSLGGFISSFDLYTTVGNGFCYSRQNVNLAGDAVYLDRPILQSGRYYGDFPLEINISGVFGGTVFNQRRELDDSTTAETDSLTREMWVGNYIRSLERQSQTNDVVAEIIQNSVSERVLSVYSAFLCLEPSRGGEICYDCLDESEIVMDAEDVFTDSPTDSLLQAFPNPFNASTTIRVRVPAGTDPRSVSLAVFDVLGREVRRFDLNAAATGTRELAWNGTDREGAPVNSGAYFLVLRIAERQYSVKLMMLK